MTDLAAWSRFSGFVSALTPARPLSNLVLTPGEARYTMCEFFRRRTRVLCAGRPPGDKSAARVPRVSLIKEEAPQIPVSILRKIPIHPSNITEFIWRRKKQWIVSF